MRWLSPTLLLLVLEDASAFAPSRPLTANRPSARLWMTAVVQDDADSRNQPEARIWKRKLAVGLALSTSFLSLNKAAHASAPVMALPKAEGRDPASEALGEMERAKMKQTQAELNEMAEKAREIERIQGEGARRKFEKQFKDAQVKRAEEQKAAVVQLKRDLLDQGIDPFIDLEGQRQVVLLEKGVDLGDVQGTPFNLEKEWERRNPRKSMKVQKAVNRQMIALMVQDLKNRDLDPLEYFQKHQDQTETILGLPEAQAASLVQQYQTNLDKYGQIKVPKEGEVSAKERMATNQKKVKKDPAARKAAKEQRKAEQAALKAQARAQRAARRAERKAAKEERKAERAALKAERKAAKADGIASPSMVEEEPVEEVEEESVELEVPAVATQESKRKIAIVPAATAVVTLGGGGLYALTSYQNKQKQAEEERQRQFRLLMGDDYDKKAGSDVIDIDDDVFDEADAVMAEEDRIEEAKPAPAPPAPIPEAPKKRGGIKGMFSKKKNSRETDIRNLVGANAEAPELASLLAKLLTFGAPGRFPSITSLPGGMPTDEFDLEPALELLNEARENSGLSLEESAEVFANVVNCMLIDIVDLASSSLKEKDEKVTIQAINIVVEFMDHAASLYEAVAGDVVITPVTYGGTLGKGKLETMYSTYAVSGMMNLGEMDDDFDNRVGLLQDVFQISEKKAEGLMMKAVQKNMMKMLKDGNGMEGMEDMLKGMGGMEGMEGLLGADGEGPSPEQLKEMLNALKEMKDSGSIPDAELEQVKAQFKEAFGSGIDEVMSDAKDGELSGEDKELLELMKSILDD